MSKRKSVHIGDIPWHEKIFHLNWALLFLITVVAATGFMALYSAAGGNLDPWASRQMTRFALSVFVAIAIAVIDIRFWFQMTWLIYFSGLVLLAFVEIKGQMGGGAQRWINLGFIQLQPSELMKIAVIMALARYFHAATLHDMRRIFFLILPACIVLAPVGLVLLQPDLGTSLMIVVAGAAMFLSLALRYGFSLAV